MSGDKNNQNKLETEKATADKHFQQKRLAATSHQEKRRGQKQAKANPKKQQLEGRWDQAQALQTFATLPRKKIEDGKDVIGPLGDFDVGDSRPATQEAQSNNAGDGDEGTTQGKTAAAQPEAGNGKEDHLFLIREARQAREAGDQTLANGLLRSLAKLYPEPTETTPVDTTGKTQIAAPLTVAATATDVCGSDDITVGNIIFAPGVIPTHGHCGLSSFYDKKIKALKGSIPLTIFDPKWQQKTSAHSAEKRQIYRGGSEERQYTGHPAPDEWSQSYAQWSWNFQYFLVTLTKSTRSKY
ncbi:hypothetical protein PCASD_07024 [Puccinia coronata f. sp. avenae]|uniref:Uncharacterized protein n=1 Tax=Puccinia coronata f. sp. avenae TaxID=200324 RepID=A0A2N5UZR2_9BASI|nr:hypothetical protein PCASD_07024 [Puccinia coronata f. sp. avenae]